MPTSLGPAEILVILVVALIVLGPKRLPEAGRQVGKALAEVRRWTTEVKSEIHSVIDAEAPGGSTVVEPVVVSATETGVDTQADVPVADVVAPVTVSGTATGVDTLAESADPPVAVRTSEPDPQAPVSAEVPAETTAVVPAETTAVVPVGTTAVVPAGTTAVVPVETTAVVPASAPVPAETTAVVAVGSQAEVPAEPTVELPESPPGDPARP